MQEIIRFHAAPKTGERFAPAVPGQNKVELQLFTTLNCNLKCSYCSAADGDILHSQGHVNYSPDELDRFIATHLQDYDVYITFYGGEPVLNRSFIAEVMRRHPQFRFQLQTNGTLLDKLPPDVLGKFDNILVSVDGGQEITDGYRGRGVYKRVIGNIGKVRPQLGGSATARMTWSNASTTFEEIDTLLQHFDYVYWQFVQAEGDYSAEALAQKKAVLSQLVKRFFARSDELYPLVPLMGIVRNKVRPDILEREHHIYSQCRVSSHIINVLPDGRIFPCPDLTYRPELQQGDLRANWLRMSPLQPDPAMPCESCEAFGFCRRNCMKNLYRAYVQDEIDYRHNVVEPICELIRFLGNEIDRHQPHAWYTSASSAVKTEIEACKVYDYVEIMP